MLLIASLLAIVGWQSSSSLSGNPKDPELRQSFTVCIDPGHPSEVGRGATGKHISEVQAVWLLACALESSLKEEGVKVILTKRKVDEFVSNQARAGIANRSRADLMVRLHMDAAPERGLATFYPSTSGTIRKKSGPSVAIQKASAVAAKAFHTATIAALAGALNDRGLRTDRQTAVGAKHGALIGSIYSEVPVVLVEVLTITNTEDEKVFRNVQSRRRIVESLQAGIMSALGAMERAKNSGRGKGKREERVRKS